MSNNIAITKIARVVLCATLVTHVAAQLTELEIRGFRNGTYPLRALPPLTYSFDSLAPHIDAMTMEFHYKQYYGACITNLNKSIGKEFPFFLKWYNDQLAKPPNPGHDDYGELLEEMLTVPTSAPESIRATVKASGGCYYNHTLFWRMMKTNGGGEPAGELAASIKRQFGSFVNFRSKFTQAAIGQPGDGWTWLTLDGSSLKIEALPGEETPLSRGRQVLLGIDVWDHAYQAQYGTNRAAYVAAWFNVVNWDFVAERYSRLKSNGK